MRSFRIYGITVLICLLIAIYTMTNAGRFHIVDEVSLLAVTESLALRGEADTNAIAWTQWVNSPGEVLGAFGPDGEVYSKKGPAPAFLAVPWYMLLHSIAQMKIEFGQVQATLLWNGIVTALTAGLLWLTAVRLRYSDRVGMALGLLFGLATIAWPYANHFFGEPLSALSLLAVFYGLLAWQQEGRVRWLWLAGLGAGVALATVTAHGVLIAILGLYGIASWFVQQRSTIEAPGTVSGLVRGVVAFAVPLGVAGVFLVWYNYLRFGNVFDTGYHFDSGEGFTTPVWQGFWGLIISPYRGVFWHTPLFIASLVGFIPFTRRHRLEGATIGLMSLALVGLYSAWWMWWGGFAWGPRFLVPMTPFWVLVLAPLVEPIAHMDWGLPRRRRVAALGAKVRSLGWRGGLLLALAAVSCGVQVLAVTANYVNYEIELRSIFPTDWDEPLKYGPPAQSLRDLLYSPVIGQMRLLIRDFVANTDLAWLWADGDIQWVVLIVGAAAIGTLGLALFQWWRAGEANDPADRLPSRPARLLLPAVLGVLLMTWVGEVSREPHYGDPAHGYRAILTTMCQEAKPGDVFINIAPFSYQIPMNWMPGLCQFYPPIYGYAKESVIHPEARRVLNRLLTDHDRIWFVTGGLPANDAENTVERWLADMAYKAEDLWFDDYRLLRYATAQNIDEAQVATFSIPLQDPEGHVVTIHTAQMPRTIEAGHILPINIDYEVVTPLESDLRWFVQLISPEAAPVALLDTSPNDGYATFTTLPVNQRLIEKAGLQLPSTMAPGVYQLIAGLYDPNAPDAARLLTPNGSEFVELGKITVE